MSCLVLRPPLARQGPPSLPAAEAARERGRREACPGPTGGHRGASLPTQDRAPQAGSYLSLWALWLTQELGPFCPLSPVTAGGGWAAETSRGPAGSVLTEVCTGSGWWVASGHLGPLAPPYPPGQGPATPGNLEQGALVVRPAFPPPQPHPLYPSPPPRGWVPLLQPRQSSPAPQSSGSCHFRVCANAGGHSRPPGEQGHPSAEPVGRRIHPPNTSHPQAVASTKPERHIFCGQSPAAPAPHPLRDRGRVDWGSVHCSGPSLSASLLGAIEGEGDPVMNKSLHWTSHKVLSPSAQRLGAVTCDGPRDAVCPVSSRPPREASWGAGKSSTCTSPLTGCTGFGIVWWARTPGHVQPER